MTENTHTKRDSGILLVILATACWSLSGTLISQIAWRGGLSPSGLAFWRDFVTFVCLAGGLLIFNRDMLRIQRRDLPWLAVMGTVSVGLFHILWNASILNIGAALSVIIQCNAPIFVTIMAFILWREPLTWGKILAVTLAVAGTLLTVRLDLADGMKVPLFWLLASLASAIAYGSFSLLGKKLSGSYSPWTVLTYVFGFASLALLPFQFGQPLITPFTAEVLPFFAVLVLFTTILGFGLYTIGLNRLEASVAAISANTEVPFATIMAYLLLGERLDGWQLLGGVLIVGGVVMLALSNRRSSRTSTTAG